MDKLKSATQQFSKKHFMYALLLFIFSWGMSYLLCRLVWKEDLPVLSLGQLLPGLLIPICLLVYSWIFYTRSGGRSFSLQFVLVILLIAFLVNILFFQFMHIRNYGDFDQLPSQLTKSTIFPRWLIGSSILNWLYHSIVIPIRPNFQSAAFVRVLGSILMISSSFFLLKKYPNRLTLILPITSPIWFLFSSGYNEYYPFIAEIFVISILLLTEDYIKGINPILLGVIVSGVSLLYVGFIPVGLLLLVAFFGRSGLKKGFIALGSMLVSFFMFIFMFWPQEFVTFFPAYYSSLNIKESVLFPGELMVHLPFFKLSYAFSVENFRRLFYDLFWACGFGVILILVFILSSKKEFIKSVFRKYNAIFLMILAVGMLAYFIFMVPRLGVTQDIDLYFATYLIVNLFSGYLVDERFGTPITSENAIKKFHIFAFAFGNSAFLILFFCFLGIPYFR